VLGYFSPLSSGWNIIISILFVSAAGMFIFNEDK
jgi:hypothetical protein